MQTHCADGVKFGMGVDFSMSYLPHRCRGVGVVPKTVNFMKFWNISALKGRIPWSEFYKIFGVYGQFHVQSIF